MQQSRLPTPLYGQRGLDLVRRQINPVGCEVREPTTDVFALTGAITKFVLHPFQKRGARFEVARVKPRKDSRAIERGNLCKECFGLNIQIAAKSAQLTKLIVVIAHGESTLRRSKIAHVIEIDCAKIPVVQANGRNGLRHKMTKRVMLKGLSGDLAGAELNAGGQFANGEVAPDVQVVMHSEKQVGQQKIALVILSRRFFRLLQPSGKQRIRRIKDSFGQRIESSRGDRADAIVFPT